MRYCKPKKIHSILYLLNTVYLFEEYRGKREMCVFPGPYGRDSFHDLTPDDDSFPEFDRRIAEKWIVHGRDPLSWLCGDIFDLIVSINTNEVRQMFCREIITVVEPGVVFAHANTFPEAFALFDPNWVREYNKYYEPIEITPGSGIQLPDEMRYYEPQKIRGVMYLFDTLYIYEEYRNKKTMRKIPGDYGKIRFDILRPDDRTASMFNRKVAELWVRHGRDPWSWTWKDVHDLIVSLNTNEDRQIFCQDIIHDVGPGNLFAHATWFPEAFSCYNPDWVREYNPYYQPTEPQE